ncbi:MAG: SDR family NAD(P)-dependent oxidoreductase [Clostridia bacterium]|nr:SDR family NAD(P)-dependent oxidoreductase [Clostridia bacterium]
MSNKDVINRYILEQVKNGILNKEMALLVLKEINMTREPVKMDIAVIGIACKFPKANNTKEYWRNLKNGVEAISGYPEERLEGLSKGHKIKAGFISGIDKFAAAFFRISPKEANLMNPAQRLFLETVWEAIEDAGCANDKIHGSKTGVYVGMDHTYQLEYGKELEQQDLLVMTGAMTSILASRISYILNLKGPSMVIDTACSSGLVAVHTACKALQNKECSMAIAGGINLIGILKTNFEGVESSEGRVSAFDKNSTGTVWGEGVGALLLKPLDQAVKDRDNIYAVIKGSAVNNDGATNGITAPSPETQAEVIASAWEDAGINPETISYIEAHATGTVLGDPIEAKGLKLAFEKYTQKKQFCGIGAVKPNIGHAVGAAGITSLIKVVLALKHKEVPPNINFTDPNPFIEFLNSPLYINDRLTKWEADGFPMRAGVSSFGFSRTNCHVVVEEAPSYNANGDKAAKEKSAYAFTLSAKTEADLKEYIRKYNDFIEECEEYNIEDICFTVSTGRGHYSSRLSMLVCSREDFEKKIKMLYSRELREAVGKDIYYNEHKVVPDSTEHTQPWEITNREKRELDGIAAKIISEGKEIEDNAYIKVLEELSRLYVKGADVRWAELYKDNLCVKVSLPTYPFERKRHWLKVQESALRDIATKNVNQKDDVAKQGDMFLKGEWVPLELKVDEKNAASGSILIFKDESGMGQQLVEALKSNGTSIIEVEYGMEFRRLGDCNYVISGTEKDYYDLLADIKDKRISQILHLSTLGRADEDFGLLEESQRRGTYSLFYLVRSLMSNMYNEPTDIVLISDYASEVTKSEIKINAYNAVMLGLSKVVTPECPNLRCRFIDIDNDITVEQMIKELTDDNRQSVVAYRNGTRYVEEFNKLDIGGIPDRKLEVKAEGAYIITGGTGGIGIEISRYLAARGKANICLINRSPMPEREQWEEILERGSNKKLCDRINAIKSIEELGSKVVCYSSDISREGDVKQVLKDIRTRFGKINGIFHCAGILSDGFIKEKDIEIFNEVIAPKVQGTLLLDMLTQEDDMDIFVMFSSIATVIGSPSMGAYCAANSYLDSFAAYRNKKGKRTVTINWPAWSETGMAVEYGISRTRGLFKTITTEKAINAFHEIVNKNIPRAVIGEFDYEAMTYILDALKINFSSDIRQMIDDRIRQAGVEKNNEASYKALVRGKNESEVTPLVTKVGQIWAHVLGLTEINIHDPFQHMGGDSILATNLLKELEKHFEGDVNISDIFTYPTVYEMSKQLDKRLNSKGATAALKIEAEDSKDDLDTILEQLRNGDISVDKAKKLFNID